MIAQIHFADSLNYVIKIKAKAYRILKASGTDLTFRGPQGGPPYEMFQGMIHYDLKKNEKTYACIHTLPYKHVRCRYHFWFLTISIKLT